MGKWWKWTLVFMVAFMMLAGCSKEPIQSNTESTVHQVIDLLVDKDYDKLFNEIFNEDLKKSMPLTDLVHLWEEQTEMGGEYADRQSIDISKKGKDYVVAEVILDYTDSMYQLRMTFDKVNRLAGFHVKEEASDTSLPAGLVEEEVVIGEGTSYELGGTLTLPEQQEGVIPSIVLVHGSGPTDRDESAYAYKPFRDIAWGIAQHGVAVLRYDKRTHIYGSNMSTEEMKKITVHEETIDDAIRASKLLKDDTRLDPNNIYVVGHSLGGMLAPRIAVEGGDFAGIISLAGSPRPLWEIIYDQNMDLLEEVPNKSAKQEQAQKINNEYKKAQQIEKMTTEESLEETIFGLPAYYFKEMDSHRPKELISELNIPILILQGEDDFQVYMEKDFVRWQDVLQDYEDDATFISYPDLNHFFVQYEGVGKGALAEYNHPGKVDVHVVDDMANWILEHVK